MMIAKALLSYGLRHTEIAELLVEVVKELDSPRCINCRVPVSYSVYIHICFTGLCFTQPRISPLFLLCAKGEPSPACL